MRCPNCGNQIEQDSVFCPFCGNKVEQPVMNQGSNGSFCPFCGTYNDDDSAFCAGCGRDLLDLDVPYDSYDDVPATKNNTVRNIIIIIIAVVALACIGGGIYMVFNSGSSQEEEEDDRDRDREKEEDEERSSDRDSEEVDEKKEENNEDRKAAEAVMDYIDDIGTVNLASSAAIEKAREEYESLTDEQKELVKNYSVLTSAESAYAELKEEEEASMYIIPESNQRLLTSSDISGMSIKELNYARNEIYARHGRRFSSNELQTYFDSKSWYNGTISASEFDSKYSGRLSEIEKKNAEYLLSQEKARGGPYVLDK